MNKRPDPKPFNPKAGRPRLKASERKSKPILVACSISEHKIIHNLAKSANKSVSRFLRELALEVEEKTNNIAST